MDFLNKDEFGENVCFEAEVNRADKESFRFSGQDSICRRLSKAGQHLNKCPLSWQRTNFLVVRKISLVSNELWGWVYDDYCCRCCLLVRWKERRRRKETKGDARYLLCVQSAGFSLEMRNFEIWNVKIISLSLLWAHLACAICQFIPSVVIVTTSISMITTLKWVICVSSKRRIKITEQENVYTI